MTDETVTSPWRMGARFAGAAVVLLLLWLQIQSAYIASLIGPVRSLLDAGQVPMTLFSDGKGVVVRLATGAGWQTFRLAGGDLAYLGQVVAMAVLLSLPGLTVRRRLAWCAVVAAVLWLSHVGVLYAGTCSAVGEYLASVPAGSEWTQAGRPWWLTNGRARQLASLSDGWVTWGGPALILMAAILSMPHHLRRTR